ncbi:hypothetical protein TRP8649_01798 [Pelagimonas phthalicica]|uniref:Uncharacterized protein n=1 Tax=Pelagimonas phthalicica TaxID=1037362 RepID=A0A238JAR4_9RHOB|nr:hypothetical protein CLV87_0275 [Pelagimonas phthalicica]SMX27689.1 hypothetical protein TRP8649_01798 [Pelagimonas phthalicica]
MKQCFYMLKSKRYTRRKFSEKFEGAWTRASLGKPTRFSLKNMSLPTRRKKIRVFCGGDHIFRVGERIPEDLYIQVGAR